MPDLLCERARDIAETALSLVRQQNLFGFTSKIYLDQVLYRLEGTWTWRDSSTAMITRAAAGRMRLRAQQGPDAWFERTLVLWRREPISVTFHFLGRRAARHQLVEMNHGFLQAPHRWVQLDIGHRCPAPRR